MRIGIGARILSYDGFGVKTYLEGLLTELDRDQRGHNIIVFCDSQEYKHKFTQLQVEVVGSKTKSSVSKLIWDHITVPAACRKFDLDWYVAPAHVRPAYLPCKSAVIVHDMMYHLFPRQWSFLDGTYFRYAVNRFTSKSDLIVADSKNTLNDIRQILKISKNNVHVVYPGIPAGFSRKSQIEIKETKHILGIEGNYILGIGTGHPRKNALLLIESFELVSCKLPELTLVLTGVDFGKQSRIRERILASPARSKIKALGLIDRNMQPALYSGAEIFVFPSLYEGFGFPLLEAMSCGCPILTNMNAGAGSELVKDCGVSIQALVKDTLSQQIVTMLSDNKELSRLNVASINQSEQFSWILAVGKFIRLIESS